MATKSERAQVKIALTKLVKVISKLVREKNTQNFPAILALVEVGDTIVALAKASKSRRA